MKNTQQPVVLCVSLAHEPDNDSHETNPVYRISAAQVLLGALVWVFCIAFVIAVYRQF